MSHQPHASQPTSHLKVLARGSGAGTGTWSCSCSGTTCHACPRAPVGRTQARSPVGCRHLMGCRDTWSPAGCWHLGSLWDASMHGLPWDAHTYGTPWDTGTRCPCGMRAHTVPCGTQAGVVGTPKGPSLHQAKCHPRATTAQIPAGHPPCCPYGPRALPGLPGSTQSGTSLAVPEVAQVPAQPFSPQCTRWDQITSKRCSLRTCCVGVPCCWWLGSARAGRHCAAGPLHSTGTMVFGKHRYHRGTPRELSKPD